MTHFPPEIIAETRARTSLVALIGRHVKLRRQGREHVGLCPFHSERTPSFTVNEDRAFFHCFGCGAHGDCIDFAMQAEGRPFAEAVELLAAQAGLIPTPTGQKPPPAPIVPRASQAEIDAEEAQRAEQANEIWQAAKPAAGTLVETYLRSRGLQIQPPPSLRFAPNLKHTDTGLLFPCMVAAVQNRERQIVGIHRTYLQPGGAAKAQVSSPKKTLGLVRGGAIRFAPPAETLALAEGIETALSIVQAMPGFAVWCSISLGNLAGSGNGRGQPHPRKPDKYLPDQEPDMERPAIELPDVVRGVVICADADNEDQESAEALLQRAVRRFQRQGRTVRVARPPQGSDFNSLLQMAEAAA